MPDPKHTKEQIDRARKDPYQRGKDDRKSGGELSPGTAKDMPQQDWQDYVDGKMGREKRKRD